MTERTQRVQAVLVATVVMGAISVIGSQSVHSPELFPVLPAEHILAARIWAQLPEAVEPAVIVGLRDTEVSEARTNSDHYRALLEDLRQGVTPQTRVLEGRLALAGGEQTNTIFSTLANQEDLARLLSHDAVSYIEPAFVDLELADSFSCGADPWVPQQNPRATDLRAPGHSDLVPYNYAFHGVFDAWRHRVNGDLPGDNIGVAVLDTGLSEKQGQFSFVHYTASTGRLPILRISETEETIDDRCSHGTKVASVVGAPLDSQSIVGVAHQSDLMAIKVTSAPLVGRAEVAAICSGIHDAVVPPDGRPAARIIVMAFGFLYISPTVEACIRAAHSASPDTLFLAAAGSQASEVIFPANMDCCVLAISLLELTDAGYRLMGRPFTVAYGPSVDLVTASTTGGIPASGLRQIGTHTDEIAKFGWSSAATATYGGLLAFASQYAKYNGWSRAQLLDVLSRCSYKADITDFSGEPVEAVVGHGLLDIYCAVGGARRLRINGGGEYVQGSSPRLLTAQLDDGRPFGAPSAGHFNYSWTVDGFAAGTDTSLSVNLDVVGNRRVTLEVIDTIDGRKLFAETSITVIPPDDVQLIALRDLAWTSHVADWATFFIGGRHDRVVNAGRFTDPRCRIRAVLGVLVNSDGIPEPGQFPRQSFDGGNVGFSVARPPERSDDDLEVLVHQWHDGFSAVRTKVIYRIEQPKGVDCAVADLLKDY